MKLKLDENPGKRGAELFIAAGHEATTVAEQGMLGKDDRRLIDHCRHEQRCLVTLDLDFSNPLIFDPTVYCTGSRYCVCPRNRRRTISCGPVRR